MRPTLLSFLLVLLLTGCAYGEDATVGGRIILWHDDDPATGSALQSLVDRFMQINPDIRVSLNAVPETEMLNRYREAAEISLGPDLFIADSRWIRELADEALIQPLDAYEPTFEQYLSTAVENVTYEGAVYGIPYGLLPSALYYDANRVSTPPATLNEMLAQAAEGSGTAMTTRFDRAMWGLRAFGGRLFDEQGRVLLDQGGFASWLTWMDTAQNATGMFLNNDRTTLLNLFTAGDVAYFVGTPADLPALQAAMGERANIRVAPLPAGPGGAAGPLLHLDTFLFNAASAARNTRAALELARFLTNDDNSLRLAREISHVPANLRVPGIDARTYPIVNGFMTQARTALPIPNTDAMASVLRDGDRIYRQVLDGVLDATAAATQFTTTVNANLGFDTTATQRERCTVNGELRVWHSWRADDLAALQAIIETFERTCTAAQVTLTRFNSPEELVETYRVLYDSNLRPDLLLVPDTLLYTLANEALVQPVPGETFEQFVPAALNALTYQNRLYGVPVSIGLTVLFYNRDQVVDPPRTLDDLLTEAAAGRGVAIVTTFEQAFWGVPAFGGGLFSPTLEPALDQNGAMTAWLTWLQQAATLPDFVISPDLDGDATAFENGEAAYFIGPSALLPRFIGALGGETIAITGLPAGPQGEAAPILRTDAFLLNSLVDAERLPLIEAFTGFVTSSESQARLFSLAWRFPANVNVGAESSSGPTTALGALQSQVARAVVYPQFAGIDMLLEAGDATYRDVLAGMVEPAEAVALLLQEIALLEPAAPPTPAASTDETPEATPEPSSPQEGPA